jgi:hypothetical protein
MFVSSSSPSVDLSALTCSNDNRVRRRAAEKRDEFAAFELIELHSIPASQGRIAG